MYPIHKASNIKLFVEDLDFAANCHIKLQLISKKLKRVQTYLGLIFDHLKSMKIKFDSIFDINYLYFSVYIVMMSCRTTYLVWFQIIFKLSIKIYWMFRSAWICLKFLGHFLSFPNTPKCMVITRFLWVCVIKMYQQTFLPISIILWRIIQFMTFLLVY